VIALATLSLDGITRAARLDDGGLVPLPDTDAVAALARDWRTAPAAGPEIDPAEATLLPLVPRPEKIIGVGLNYVDHAAEAKRPTTEHPTLFSIPWRSLIGPRDPLVLPRNSEQVDWEAELAVVIGSQLRRADETEAREGIAGYAIVNDVSMRDWQRRTTQFFQGKAFESSTPLGPYLVPGAEIDEARDLRITCSIDGVVKQDASTADMIFGPIALVSYISQFVTLVPGDVIMTGTPAGIGSTRRPREYLQPGQVLRTAIEGLGEQVNECVPEEAAPGAPS
jgi:acylpyruvate hydrolase